MNTDLDNSTDIKRVNHNFAKYDGKKSIINKKTGKEQEVQVIIHNSIIDKDFHEIWIGHLSLALNIVGNVKTKILSYLLKNTTATNNMIIKTQKEVAKELDVSRVSVNQTIKILENANILRKKTGVIIINPDILVMKNKNIEKFNILHYYNKK